MIVTRETIYAAFWAKLSGLPDFKTKSRRLRHWEDVAPVDQPALFMTEHAQAVQQTKGIPPSWTLSINLYLYDNCGGNADAIPGQRLNALIDAVDAALAPGVTGYQTLGGLVSHCWITGSIDIYEGFAGMMDQSVAIIPVEIKVPDASGPV